jgi:hypothetical protein
MPSGWRSKALWVAALLPLLAASVLPTQIRTLVCRFTGAIMQEEICCPSALDEKTPPAAQLLGENCCVVKTVDLPKLVSEHSTDGLPPVQALALAVAQPSSTLVFPSRWAPSLPVRPPPHGPPILLVKRSFLI